MPVPRPEYPRPQFDRSHAWATLNGTWEFARDPSRTLGPHEALDQRCTESIVVPFAWETPASGVEARWLERGWYRRRLSVPARWHGQRIVLHFGAVHHHAAVWIAGTYVGEHTGGYLPFEFDITDALAGAADATVLVRVDAPVDKRYIAHGKQRSIPRDDYDGCSFTPSSGIWQPVWLEARPATHLGSLRIEPTATLDGFLVRADVLGPHAADAAVTIRVADEAAVTTSADEVAAGVTVPVAEPRLWSPADPSLYPVTVTVTSTDGEDRVSSEAGLRSIEARGPQLYLNGQRIAVRGVLDQGYWPDTGITAPDDHAFVRDLELARQAGFTLVRKHLKLEDPRFHHHADHLGMLLWAEPASTGRFTAESTAAFTAQIEPMARRDGNHPSIVIWGLYNEEWGLDWALPDDPDKQQAVLDAYHQLRKLDPTRLIVDNSGWTHLETDLIDWHVYDEEPSGWARKVAALVTDDEPAFPVAIAVDTTVDKALMVKGPVPRDLPLLNSEFGGGHTSVQRGWNLHWQTQELRRHDRIAGYVWTELTDIEHETAGVADFHRRGKDHGNRPPAHVNADTVPVLDITPLEPGRDLVAPDGDVSFTVAVSHHGTDPLTVTVNCAWGPVMGAEHGEEQNMGVVEVRPFELSSPVPIAAPMPQRAHSARLHILLRSADTIVGRGAVDVSRD